MTRPGYARHAEVVRELTVWDLAASDLAAMASYLEAIGRNIPDDAPADDD